MTSAVFSGIALAWSRIGTPRALAVAISTLVLVLAAAGWERAHAAAVAADRTLTGVVFGLALPLLAFYVIREVTAHRRLDDSVLEVARHGANRRWASLGLIGTAAGVLAVLSGLLAGTGVVAARGLADPLLASDLAVSCWVGGLAGVSYAGLLGLGSCLGRHGGGRFAWLVLDWWLGAGTSALAIPWPRGHLRNLLGAEPVLALSQGAGLVTLVGLLVAYGLLAMWRTPP